MKMWNFFKKKYCLGRPRLESDVDILQGPAAEPLLKFEERVMVAETVNLGMNCCTCCGRDAFESASVGDTFRVMELVRRNPGLLTEVNSSGRGILYCAILGNHADLVEKLLRLGAHWERRLSEPDYEACLSLANIKIRSMLLAKRPRKVVEKVQVPRASKQSVAVPKVERPKTSKPHEQLHELIRLIKRGKYEEVASLVDKNPGLVELNFMCRTPLFFAINHKQEQIALYLLRECPDVVRCDAREFQRCVNQAETHGFTTIRQELTSRRVAYF